ncbi:MAG: hypothetical protein ABIK40_03105, partial [candidate division WOR-3 bacterium]
YFRDSLKAPIFRYYLCDEPEPDQIPTSAYIICFYKDWKHHPESKQLITSLKIFTLFINII